MKKFGNFLSSNGLMYSSSLTSGASLASTGTNGLYVRTSFIKGSEAVELGVEEVVIGGVSGSSTNFTWGTYFLATPSFSIIVFSLMSGMGFISGSGNCLTSGDS